MECLRRGASVASSTSSSAGSRVKIDDILDVTAAIRLVLVGPFAAAFGAAGRCFDMS